MKRLLPFALVCLSFTANAFEYEGIEYSINDDGQSVTLANGQNCKGDLIIPSTVTDPSDEKEYPVTAIKKQAFAYAEITSAEIPGSVKLIDRLAFSYSTIKSVKLSEGIETIGYCAFSNCTSLTSVTIPSSVKIIGDYSPLSGDWGGAFFHCTSLKEANLPEGIEVIYSGTFKECQSLTDVNIPSTVQRIESQAFASCLGLTSVTLPESVTEIGESAFSYCASLESATLPDNLTSIPHSAFVECTSLKSINIPQAATVIGKQAFAACNALTEIVIPDAVEHITTDAFSYCGNVKTIRLGTGVRRIGNSAIGVYTPDMLNNAIWALTDIWCMSETPATYYHETVIHELPEDFFFASEKEVPLDRREKFYSEVKLHVPAEALEAYQASPQWGKFKNIIGDAAGIDGEFLNGKKDIRISGSEIEAEGAATIAVYSLSGAAVRTSENGRMDISDIPAGVYIVKADGQAEKFIKK